MPEPQPGMPTQGARNAPQGAVIIPAFQEQQRIAPGLRALLDSAKSGQFQVIVAANGCTDETATKAREVAAQTGQTVTVLEIPTAGKANAIRLAEAATDLHPRLYLDADVTCPTQTAAALLTAVTEGGWQVAVPTRQLDLTECSWFAKQYYLTWSDLPWVRSQLTGRGALALSERTRATFDTIPDLVADDRFLTSRAPREEAVIIREEVQVRPPRTLAEVVRVRRRIYAGNRDHRVPTHDAHRTQRGAHLVSWLRQPRKWPGLLVFVAVTALAKVPSGRQIRWGK